MTLKDLELPRQCPKCQCTAVRDCLFYRHNGCPLKNIVLSILDCLLHACLMVMPPMDNLGRQSCQLGPSWPPSEGIDSIGTRYTVCVLFFDSFSVCPHKSFWYCSVVCCLQAQYLAQMVLLGTVQLALLKLAYMGTAMYKTIFIWF